MDDVSIRDYADTVVIHCTDSFLQLSAPQFLAACNALLPKRMLKSIIFDFSTVTTSKATVPGNLLKAVSRFTGLNIRTYLHKAPQACLQLLKDAELLDFFTVLESDDDLLLILPD